MLNKYSRIITQDETQPASQAMLYALGLQEEDLNKAQKICQRRSQSNP